MSIPQDRPLNIQIRPLGNLGNRMMQYMAALKLRSLVPSAHISNVDLPEWNITVPPLDQGDVDTERFVHGHHMKIDFPDLLAKVNAHQIQRYELGSYAAHMDNFLEASVYRDIFKPPTLHEGFDERHLVCNIRAADVLEAKSPYYTVLPPEFYQDLARQTGLKMVFMGQLGDDPYTTALRRLFPDAVFQPSIGALGDFETLRNSKNIVLSVSTFSWLAGWLSHADQIVLPLAGFYSFAHFKQIDLLPLNDPRYRFFQFPHYVAAPAHQLPVSLNALGGLWREVDGAMVEACRNNFPRFPVDKKVMKDAFDEQYYLQEHPDIRTAVQEKRYWPRGIDHYDSHGFAEQRSPFRLDPVWYQSQYPAAAVEVGQGDFAGFHEHYARVGRKRGYLPYLD